MVGAILDFTPYNVLNVGESKYVTKVKHKKNHHLNKNRR